MNFTFEVSLSLQQLFREIPRLHGKCLYWVNRVSSSFSCLKYSTAVLFLYLSHAVHCRISLFYLISSPSVEITASDTWHPFSGICPSVCEIVLVFFKLLPPAESTPASAYVSLGGRIYGSNMAKFLYISTLF